MTSWESGTIQSSQRKIYDCKCYFGTTPLGNRAIKISGESYCPNLTVHCFAVPPGRNVSKTIPSDIEHVARTARYC